ncbi:MAG: tetratricopeptide repeat protein [Candidatus Omnitrophica bacterium]|nr:tetratricopeptide repeat protein [Candidatus Omnitrophota bacterium]
MNIIGKYKVFIPHRRTCWLALLLIIVFTTIVYTPSFFHMGRSDQENYFAETAQLNGFVQTVENTYSYSRQRIFFAGDFQMFKPLYFVLLAAEKSVFGCNPFGWQVTSVILHLLVVWQLFRLLYLIYPSFGAVVMSAFFALMLMTQDMVTFQHMNICMVAHILILESFIAFIKYCDSGQTATKYFWRIFACMSLACFIREFSLVYTVIIFFGLLVYGWFKFGSIKGWKLWSLLWFPIIIYTIWDVIDYIVRVKISYHTGQLVGSLLPVLKFYGLSWVGGVIPGVFNYHMPIFPGMRVVAGILSPSEMIDIGKTNILIINAAWLMVFMLLLIGVIVRVCMQKGEKIFYGLKDPRILTGIMALGCSLSYSVIVTWGRFQERGMENLYYNMYYFYAPVFFNLIFGYTVFFSLMNFIKVRERRVWLGLFASILILITAWNAWANYQLNMELKEFSSPYISRQKIAGFSNYYLARRYNALGAISAAIDNYSQAFDYYNKTLLADPQNEFVNFNLGVLYAKEKKYYEALKYFNFALKSDVADKTGVYLQRGIVLINLRRYNDALMDIDRVLFLDPANQDALRIKSLFKSPQPSQ